MTEETARKLARAWLREAGAQPRLNLLDVQDDQVTPRLSIRAKLGMKRSPELSEKLKSIRTSVQKEFKKPGKPVTEGICYLVYCFVIPHKWNSSQIGYQKVCTLTT